MKKRSCAGLILDFILTIMTGGLWLIWILIRYLRNSWFKKGAWNIASYFFNGGNVKNENVYFYYGTAIKNVF